MTSEDTVNSDWNEINLDDRYSKASQVLCNAGPGEDVVIAGMAGKFPDSDNIQELRDNLLNKVDLISDDNRRWPPINPEIPHKIGKVNDVSSFDAGFFGIYSKRANNMDVFIRMMLETTYEAIRDAGLHPSELVGTKTGVFIVAGISDSENYNFYHNFTSDSATVLGTTRSMIAHYVSYFLRLQGPSFITDSACCSGMYSIEHAYRSIREGICDMAIVGGTNLCLHSTVSLQFAKLGVLNSDGRCKTFDKNADGYVRSETCSALFLQKSKDARRIYAHIVHCKLSCDGYKQEGITHPSSRMQTILMEQTYKECDVDLSDVSYVEAHGTGTKIGDPQELNALANAFCTKRKSPLYIGSIKSNLGHSESAAGLSGVIKVLLAMECELIIPNINYSQPREDVDALVKGRLIVPTEKTSWPNKKGIAGVHCLGLGGADGHIILRWNRKLNRHFGLSQDDLPRLVCASGRTKEAIDIIFNYLISSRSLDLEFLYLLNTIFEKPTLDHPFCGYQIITDYGEVKRSVNEVEDKSRLAWVFNNFEANWPKVGKQLMIFPVFGEALKIIQSATARSVGVDVINLLETFATETMRNQMLATMAIQICLASLLKSVGLIPDVLIGLGTGELIVAYLEDYLTLDEVISAHLFTATAFFNNINKSLIKEELLNNFKNLKLTQNGSFQKWLPLHRPPTHIYKQGSPEYFARNLLESFDLKEVKRILSHDCEILVIGGQIDKFEDLSLIPQDSQECVHDFLTKLGRFYERGHHLRVNNLYAKTTWPVSRGTPMISPLIKWEHTQKWHVPFQEEEKEKSRQRTILIDIKRKDWKFLAGHVVDGRILFPATGYLFLVWQTLADIKRKPMSQVRIVFEDVKFRQAVNLNNQEIVPLVINILKSTNTFEISERGALLVTGTVYEVLDSKRYTADLPEPTTFEFEKVTLEHAEIYRELRLRGYEYKGEFKAVKCEVGQGNVLINWTGNWVAFLDNMLQTMALYLNENRNLHVLTSIQYIVIDPIAHLEAVGERKDAGANTLIPVRLYQDLDVIKSPGVQLNGFRKEVISRRKNDEPLLETYKFIPNVTDALSLEESIRIIVQIIVENERVQKFKSVELAGESELISPHMKHALDDLPLMEADITVLTKKPLELNGVQVQDGSLMAQGTSLIVILSQAFQKCEMLQDALKLVKCTGGYVLTRETFSFDNSNQILTGLDIICVHKTDKENLVLLRKSTDYKQPMVIKISDDFSWLPAAKDALKQSQRLIFYSQNMFTNGILGLVNCLRKEPNGDCLSCFFIVDDAPEFDFNHPFYAKQIKKNIIVNVWKAGQWGTYRHLPLKRNVNVECGTYYANVTVPGKLSSIKFIEGNPKEVKKLDVNLEMVYVYSASIIFKDLLIASGRISTDNAGNRFDQECLLGYEFSGRDINGKRVMGFARTGALASHVITKSSTIWTVPDHWSLEDAATVPCAYITVIYGLLMKAKLKHGQSILIHVGAGGVGQAAINIALHFDCTIFVTVGTQEKRSFLKSKYPQIKDAHIGNSRDTSFEQVVLLQTNGRGVDVVLNSLTEDKLQASTRCLARNGTFLEIGKVDLEKDNHLETRLFRKGISFQSVMLDLLYAHESNLAVKEQISRHFKDLLEKGVIKPLPRTVFGKEKIIDAFKLMTTGKYIGKIIVNIRKEEEETLVAPAGAEFYEGLPRYHCEADGVYIVVGGLGGFGLQLTDWLILRGARKIILSSRTGLKTRYQTKMLRMWKLSDVQICVRTDDVTTEAGCLQLITFANSLGPVKAIFNFALVLKDALFENQTVESFQASLAPKALATQYFDTVTRLMCSELSEFVVFSSVCCGRGNIEQSNYGMANSIMERICEKRKAEGFHALAIQWGAIADVGAIAEVQENVDSEVIIGGFRQQRISSCLQVLDVFLRQEEPVVSSVIFAQKDKLFGGDTIDVTLTSILDNHKNKRRHF